MFSKPNFENPTRDERDPLLSTSDLNSGRIKMFVGYARVSTCDQKLDLQLKALKKAGCAKVFSDHGVSGRTAERPGLDLALSELKKGDTLIVWRLDRLGRSLIHLVQLVDELGKKGIDFQSLSENIDSGSPAGRLLFHMMAALAEFERGLISERTRAGMQAAKEGGQRIGRRPKLSTDELKAANEAILSGSALPFDVASSYGLKPRALKRMIQNRVKSE